MINASVPAVNMLKDNVMYWLLLATRKFVYSTFFFGGGGGGPAGPYFMNDLCSNRLSGLSFVLAATFSWPAAKLTRCMEVNRCHCQVSLTGEQGFTNCR